MKRPVALAGALGILAFAWWVEHLYELSRLDAARTFGPNRVFWAWLVAQLVLAGLVLMLAWFAILKNGASLLVFLVYLLVGLLIPFSISLDAPLSTLPSFLWQPLSVFLPVLPRSMLFQASAFTTIIGIIGPVARRRPWFGR